MLSDKVKNAILEDLNMKEDEEFGIEDSNYMRRINKNGIQFYKNSSDGWSSSAYLNELLLGKVKIIKLPFVPENETYYIPDISIANLYRKIWNYGTKHDKHRIEYEMCFRTKQEAIAKAKEWLKLIKEGNAEYLKTLKNF